MIIDANAWLGKWPFGEQEPDTSRELMAHQASIGINLTSVASIDAVFYVDPGPANARLYREVRDHPTLEPVAVINPTIPNWRNELDQWAEHPNCRQIRLVPSYHQYTLDDPRLEALLDACAEAEMRVSIAVRLEDERAHHPLMKVPSLTAGAIAELAARRREQRFLILGGFLGEVVKLADQPNLLFDISQVEYLDTLNYLLERVRWQQVVFGTHTPFLVTRAALAKVSQSTADNDVKQAVAAGNLSEWLGGERTAVPWLD